MDTEVVEALLELGLTPLDWVNGSQFSKLTGIEEHKLDHRRKKWPENRVWTKQDGNIYFSLKGFCAWLTEQASGRYLAECASETEPCKSTSSETKKRTTSPSHSLRTRKVSKQLLNLEVN